MDLRATSLLTLSGSSCNRLPIIHKVSNEVDSGPWPNASPRSDSIVCQAKVSQVRKLPNVLGISRNLFWFKLSISSDVIREMEQGHAPISFLLSISFRVF